MSAIEVYKPVPVTVYQMETDSMVVPRLLGYSGGSDPLVVRDGDGYVTPSGEINYFVKAEKRHLFPANTPIRVRVIPMTVAEMQVQGSVGEAPYPPFHHRDAWVDRDGRITVFLQDGQEVAPGRVVRFEEVAP